MEETFPLKWKRSESVAYPKVWHTFMARDLNSDQLIEYRIEDLTEDRAEEAYKHMRENYLQDEPVSQALGGGSDIKHYEDYLRGWKSAMKQKMPLVCYREGSDEIVGLNFNFITSKEDKFFEKILEKSESPVTEILFGAAFIVTGTFNVYEHYGVNEYLGSLGLSVNKKYRGRSIGDHLMATRKLVMKEFGLKVSHTIFSSDYSSRNAENVGFKTDTVLSYVDIMKIKPEYDLSKVKSSTLSMKSLLC